MKLLQPLALVVLFAASQAVAVDYRTQIAPILNQRCGNCHKEAGGKKPKGDFAIDRLDDMQKQVKAGEPQKSSLVISITLPEDDEDVMPPKGKGKVTPNEVAMIRKWIEEGASFTVASAPPPAPTAAPAAPGTPPAAPAMAATPQKWTNTAGSVIEATFEGMDGADRVLLKVVATGIVHTVPLASLSPESQAMARNGGK